MSEIHYDPFGGTRYTSHPLPTDYRYTGQREHAEIGLYFYNARWYDSSLGHFVQADTMVPGAGNPMAWDRFSYVLNNPIRLNDPTGHQCESGSNPETDCPDDSSSSSGSNVPFDPIESIIQYRRRDKSTSCFLFIFCETKYTAFDSGLMVVVGNHLLLTHNHFDKNNNPPLDYSGNNGEEFVLTNPYFPADDEELVMPYSDMTVLKQEGDTTLIQTTDPLVAPPVEIADISTISNIQVGDLLIAGYLQDNGELAFGILTVSATNVTTVGASTGNVFSNGIEVQNNGFIGPGDSGGPVFYYSSSTDTYTLIGTLSGASNNSVYIAPLTSDVISLIDTYR